VTGYIPRWFTRPQTVSHTSTNPAVHSGLYNVYDAIAMLAHTEWSKKRYPGFVLR